MKQDILNIANSHREADERCGRPWTCACGACRMVRAELKQKPTSLLPASPEPPKPTDTEILNRITEILNTTSDWNADTIDSIAYEVSRTGREVPIL